MMYSNGYAPQPPQRHRRSDRYAAQGNAQPSYSNPSQPLVQGGAQPNPPVYRQGGTQPMPQRTAPRQGVPPVAQQMRPNYPPVQQGTWNQHQKPTDSRFSVPAVGQGMNPPPRDHWQQPMRHDQGGFQPMVPAGGMQQGFRPAPVQPKGKGSGQGGGTSGKFSWKAVLLALVLVGLLVIGVMVGTRVYEDRQLKEYVAGFDQVYCDNVYVDGIHLGGMTQQQAFDAVTAKARERNDAWSVSLTYQGQVVTEFRASQLGMTVDVTEQLRQAWNQGHTGDAYQRLAAMEQLSQQPYLAFTALPSGDTSVVDSVLAEIRNKVYKAPQDAAIIAFNPNRVTDPFDITDEIPGYSLDTEPIKEKIYQMVSTLESGSIEIVPTIIQPQTTRADLEKLVSLRSSAYTKISTTSTENRTNNIKRAFQLINGTILQPGETFSFNKIVGERSLENGFFEAIEYAYKEEVMGVGGGVCQASSTVYQAAVAAGMDITKREQHSLEVNYTEFGMDATVYWSKNRKIDLAFKNTSEHPVYIVASVQSDPDNRKRSIAKVSIYGENLGSTEYRLEAKTVEVLQPPEETKYVKDKKQEYVTYTDQEKVVQKAEEGYLIESYCVKYVDGVEVERALLYIDRYEPLQKTVYVGVQERE